MIRNSIWYAKSSAAAACLGARRWVLADAVNALSVYDEVSTSPCITVVLLVESSRSPNLAAKLLSTRERPPWLANDPNS